VTVIKTAYPRGIGEEGLACQARVSCAVIKRNVLGSHHRLSLLGNAVPLAFLVVASCHRTNMKHRSSEAVQKNNVEVKNQ
jgi:hypothetical protein